MRCCLAFYKSDTLSLAFSIPPYDILSEDNETCGTALSDLAEKPEHNSAVHTTRGAGKSLSKIASAIDERDDIESFILGGGVRYRTDISCNHEIPHSRGYLFNLVSTSSNHNNIDSKYATLFPNAQVGCPKVCYSPPHKHGFVCARPPRHSTKKSDAFGLTPIGRFEREVASSTVRKVV